MVWKDVVGYEGLYKVSDKGQILSVKRLVRRGQDGQRTVRERLLKTTIAKNGYHHIHLCKQGKIVGWLVHRLVLLAFVGRCPHGMEACHHDGNPSNNSRENLYWGTRLQNCQDTIRHGRTTVGERNAQAKITWAIVRQIRRLYQPRKVTQKQLAHMFQISRENVSQITLNKAWRENEH